MPHPRPGAVLLDVMETLVHEPFRREMPAFFGLDLEGLLAVKHPTLWIEFEEGRVDEEAFLAGFFADGRDYDREGFRRCVRSAYRWLDGMEALCADLARAGAELHACSNYPVWYRWIEEELALSRFLRWSFVSCDLGVRKPDRRVFELALERLGRPPGEVLFVDDREENCAAARELGIEAVLFRGAGPLRAELRARGLLP